MKQYFYIGNIKTTLTRRYVLCLCVLPAIIILIMLACLAGIIEGLEKFYQSAKEFSFDMFRVFKKTWKKR